MHSLLVFLVFIFSFSANAQVPASMRNAPLQQAPSSLSSIDAIKQSLQNTNFEATKPVDNKPKEQEKQPEVVAIPNPTPSATSESIELPKNKVATDEIKSLDAIINNPEKIEQAQDAAVERQENESFGKQKEPSSAVEEKDEWVDKISPPKSSNNILRVKYKSNIYDLSDADKLAINSMINILKDKNIKKIIINSASAKAASNQEEREIALLRALNFREYLKKQDYNIENVDYKVFDSANNKFNLNFIDVDKE